MHSFALGSARVQYLTSPNTFHSLISVKNISRKRFPPDIEMIANKWCECFLMGAYAAYVRCHFWFKKWENEWCVMASTSAEYDIRTDIFMFLFLLVQRPSIESLSSAEIHYDVWFINRSNLPYTLTPDDLFLFFIFFVDKQDIFKYHDTKSPWVLVEIRTSRLLWRLEEIGYVHKIFKHVFEKQD